MPEVKTYRADSMQAALSLVRRELGPDALILHTRQVPRKSLLPWQGNKLETEILAIAEDTPRAAQAPAARATAVASANVTATREQQHRETPLSVEHRWTESDPRSPHPRDENRQHNADPRSQSRPAPLLETFSRMTEETRPITPTSSSAKHVAESATLEPSVAESAVTDAAASPSRESARIEAIVNERLDVLQKMVEHLSQRLPAEAPPPLPAELFRVYTQLIDADVDEQVARELTSRLQKRCRTDDLASPGRITTELRSLLETTLRCRGAIRVTPGQQKIVALVGPTGVGKTTTIAKLAANFKLRDNIRMGLITVDTYRIAAVEQLRTYAEIIDLPMKVVTTPEEMQAAVQELAHLDLILIDTAGRSPQDDVRIHELNTFLNEVVVDEIHLVISATTSPRHLRQMVERFAPVQPTALILTKLDEAPGAGVIANLASQFDLPFSYLTTGQNVPRDIEPASLTRSVRLILGEDALNS